MSPFVCEKVQNENPYPSFKLFTVYCKERAEIQILSKKLFGWMVEYLKMSKINRLTMKTLTYL